MPNRDYRYQAAAAMVFVAAFAAGCSGGTSADRPTEVVYRCTETQEFVLAAPQPVPAINSKTGESTLMRALYCPQCGEWHVAPPPEIYNGNPAGYPCPRHRTAMLEQGPLPD